MSKLIYSVSSERLQLLFQNIQDADAVRNSAYYSVAFTGDGYIYTHGKKFRLFTVVNDVTTGLAFNITNGSASVTIDGASIGSGNVVTSITGDNIVVATAPSTWNGSITLSHKEYIGTLLSPTLYGANNKIPSITVDKYGHITAISESSALDFEKVQSDLLTNADNGQYYLIGITDNTGQHPKYSTDVYIDKSGGFNAKTISINGTSIASLYAGYSHLTLYADIDDYGHVKLSDAIDDSLSDVDAHIAATPKAITLAISSAQQYARNLMAALDVMVFAGTLKANGVISSHNDNILEATDNTTNITSTNYKAGWTFRFVESGTFLSLVVEVGDMIIAVKSKNEDFAISDWTIIQTNINGALTASTIPNGLLYANNSREISALSLSNNGVLVNNNGTLSFSNSNAIWRTISVDGTSIGDYNLNLISDTNIAYTVTNGDVTLNLNESGIIATASTLYFSNGTDNIFSYHPSNLATLVIGDMLSINTTNSVTTLNHAAGTRFVSKLGYITTDNYGHITSITDITALPNEYSFTIKDNSGVSQITYNGSNALSLKFANGTDITLAFSTSGDDKVITPSITHKYRPISYYTSSTATIATSILTSSQSNAFSIKPGDFITLSVDNEVMTISAENTWRNIDAYKVTNNVLLRSSIGDIALKFDDSFLLTTTSGVTELGICWTEIDNSGNITYVR